MLKGALLCNEWILLQCCLGKYDRGGRASALFLPPHHRAFGSLSALTKKNANARGLSGGGRGLLSGIRSKNQCYFRVAITFGGRYFGNSTIVAHCELLNWGDKNWSLGLNYVTLPVQNLPPSHICTINVSCEHFAAQHYIWVCFSFQLYTLGILWLKTSQVHLPKVRLGGGVRGNAIS